jgi:hypothetical protein
MYTHSTFMYMLGTALAPRDWNPPNCHIVAGVKSPANAMFEQTNTRYPQVIAKRMLLSCELRRPMEKRKRQSNHTVDRLNPQLA